MCGPGAILSDVRRAMHLVGECRELGRDPAQWRTHVCQRLNGMVGAISSESFEVPNPIDGRPPRIFIDFGLDVGARAVLHGYVGRAEWADDPMPVAIVQVGRPALTLTRQQLVPDRSWYAARAVSDVRRAAGVNHCLASHRTLLRHGVCDEMGINRPLGDRPFGERERRLVSLFHTELARLWTRRPASAAVPAQVAELPPRAQRVYSFLVRGATERQAAAKLGLAPQTVHSYVKLLYQRLNVNSRAELLLRFQPAYDFTPRLTTSTVTGR